MWRVGAHGPRLQEKTQRKADDVQGSAGVLARGADSPGFFRRNPGGVNLSFKNTFSALVLEPDSVFVSETFVPVVAENISITSPPDETQKTQEKTKKTKDIYVRRSFSDRNYVPVSITLKTFDTLARLTPEPMLDCGASDSFVDQEFVKKNNIKTKKLTNPAVIRNTDGTANNAGRVTEKVEASMRYKGHIEVMTFYVTNLGNVDVILGLTWLKKHNPEIDWKTGEVVMSRCPKQCLNLQVKEAWDIQNELYPGEEDTEEDMEEVEEVAKHKLGLRNISVAGVRQWNRLRSGYLRNLDDLTNQYHESVARMYVNRMWKTHMQVEIEEEEEMHLRAIGK